MDNITFYAFRNELVKIAQYNQPNNEEVSHTVPSFLGADPRYMNKEVFKQFLKNLAVIGGSLGLGYGTASLGMQAVKKYTSKIPEKIKIPLKTIGTLGALSTVPALYLAYRKRAEDLLEQARIKGEARQLKEEHIRNAGNTNN